MDADPHEVALWVLLKRAQSANKAIRLQAVQELAENHHWHGKIHKKILQITPGLQYIKISEVGCH